MLYRVYGLENAFLSAEDSEQYELEYRYSCFVRSANAKLIGHVHAFIYSKK